MNQVTISASEFIRLVNRIKELENTLVRIAMLADLDEFESQEINAICMLAIGATTEESSADHLRDAAKMIRAQAAIAAMQGHIVHRGFSENGKHVADLAIRHADALIAALKNEVQL